MKNLMKRHSYFFTLVLLLATTLQAGEILVATVEHKDKRYFVSLDVLINADSERVYSALTNFNQLSAINPAITNSNLIYSLSDTQHRVEVKIESCITFFCKKLVQVQDVEELPGKLILTTVVPEKSDFDYAHARWKVSSEQGRTRVTFDSDLKPSFWVPPLIGPLLIEKKLRDDALAVVDGLEQLAQ